MATWTSRTKKSSYSFFCRKSSVLDSKFTKCMRCTLSTRCLSSSSQQQILSIEICSFMSLKASSKADKMSPRLCSKTWSTQWAPSMTLTFHQTTRLKVQRWQLPWLSTSPISTLSEISHNSTSCKSQLNLVRLNKSLISSWSWLRVWRPS